MGLLRALGLILLVGAGVVFVVALLARFSDGPIGPFPGGTLHAGELVTDPDVDWSFAADVEEIELQLVEPPRSRTVWIAVVDGEAYAACGFLDVPLWKQWPHEVAVDGRVVVRVDGRRYEREAVRVTEPALLEQVARAFSSKYDVAMGGSDFSDPDGLGTWFFRLEPRPEG